MEPGSRAETGQVVFFRIGSQEFATDVAYVEAVIDAIDVTNVPGAHDEVRGVINLRGRIVPVVDLGHRLGVTEPAGGAEPRFLIADLPTGTVAVLVDDVVEVHTLEPGTVQPPPATAANNGEITGMIFLEDRLVLLVDLASTLQPQAASVAKL